jgi:hypothetical protein
MVTYKLTTMPKTGGKMGVYFHPFLTLAKETVQTFLNEFPVKLKLIYWYAL